MPPAVYDRVVAVVAAPSLAAEIPYDLLDELAGGASPGGDVDPGVCAVGEAVGFPSASPARTTLAASPAEAAFAAAVAAAFFFASAAATASAKFLSTAAASIG